MEYIVPLREMALDVAALEDALLEIDPSAVHGLDASGQTLHVAAAMEASDLVELLQRLGFPVTRKQISQLPSICCGDCSG